MDRYYINDISKELIATYMAIKSQDCNFLTTLNDLNKDWKLLSTLDYTSFDFDIEKFDCCPSLVVVEKYNLKSFFMDYLLNLKSSYYATIRKIYNRNRKNNETQENTAFYFFIREFCYSSMFRFSKNGDFNVPYGGMSYNSKNFDKKLEYLCSYELNARFNNTDIFDEDFQEFINMFSFNEDDFIFVDPPYDTEFSTYDENNFGEHDQIRLADFLRSTAAKWLLVIKDTDFIRSLYPKENSRLFYKEFNKNYSVSFMNRNDRSTTHLMITNYEV